MLLFVLLSFSLHQQKWKCLCVAVIHASFVIVACICRTRWTVFNVVTSAYQAFPIAIFVSTGFTTHSFAALKSYCSGHSVHANTFSSWIFQIPLTYCHYWCSSRFCSEYTATSCCIHQYGSNVLSICLKFRISNPFIELYHP